MNKTIFRVYTCVTLACILGIAACDNLTEEKILKSVQTHGNNRKTKQWYVSTFAGGAPGYKEGTADIAQFDSLSGIAIAFDGTIYVTDTGNHRIRKISTDGKVITIAGSDTRGSADGTGTSAQFDYPQGIAIASDGTMYVADTGNHRIRKISTDGKVITIAGSGLKGSKDGAGTSAQFDYPQGIAVASDGTMYVADTGNHRIRKISTDGKVSTLAGSGWRGHQDGIGTSAKFYYPEGIAVASDGTIYVADTDNHRIRKITTEGEVSTFVGDAEGYKNGAGIASQFYYPDGIAIASDGTIYVADTSNHCIKKISIDGKVMTIAGGALGDRDGAADIAEFNILNGIAVASDGTIYVADTSNHRIRKISHK